MVNPSIRIFIYIYMFETIHPEKGSTFPSSIYCQMTTYDRTIRIVMDKPESIMVPQHGKGVSLIGDVRWI